MLQRLNRFQSRGRDLSFQPWEVLVTDGMVVGECRAVRQKCVLRRLLHMEILRQVVPRLGDQPEGEIQGRACMIGMADMAAYPAGAAMRRQSRLDRACGRLIDRQNITPNSRRLAHIRQNATVPEKIAQMREIELAGLKRSTGGRAQSKCSELLEDPAGPAAVPLERLL